MKASLQGMLEDFDLPQIVSILEVGRSTGALKVQGGAETGVLYMKGGEIISAELGPIVGESAAMAVLVQERGEFTFHKEDVSISRIIDRSNQGLCLEAMRLLDESLSGEVAFDRDPERVLDDLNPLGRQVALAIDGPTLVQKTASSCGIPPIIALCALEELEGLGIVRRCDIDEATLAMTCDDRIRVLLVDDSKLMQKVLRRIYESDPEIEIVGVAENGEHALELLAECKPDVVSLDLYMPVMDGVTTLKRIMLSQPTPTVIVTSANADELDLTFDSILRFGAIDFITKPSRTRSDMSHQVENILDRLRKAAKVNLRGLRIIQPPTRSVQKRSGNVVAQGVIASFAGTGGCLSYMQFLSGLPMDLPIGVVGQLRFPPDFLRAFINYLNRSVSFKVEAAVDGAQVLGGVCYLASDLEEVGFVLTAEGPSLRVRTVKERTDPAQLFMSAARAFGERSVGLLLSGCEGDVIPGLASIRAKGGVTMIQLPETCVDQGELARVIELKLADRVVLLPQISNDLSQVLLKRLRGSDRDFGAKQGGSSWPRKSA